MVDTNVDKWSFALESTALLTAGDFNPSMRNTKNSFFDKNIAAEIALDKNEYILYQLKYGETEKETKRVVEFTLLWW